MSRYDRDEDIYGGGRWRGRDYDEERDARARDYGRGAYSEYDEGLARARGYDYERARGRDYDEDRRDGRDYERERYAPPRRGASRSHVRCRDIMTRDVTVATRATTLGEVAKLMRDEDTGVIPVVELDDTTMLESDTRPEHAPRIANRMRSNGKLVGLITDRDIVVRAIAEGKDVTVTRAEEIMTTDIHAAHPNDRVIDTVRKMGDKQVRRIPIVDRDGNLRGIISMADVALETNDDRELADALEEISSGASFWNRVFG
jgi:CBS domain-containing protein